MPNAATRQRLADAATGAMVVAIAVAAFVMTTSAGRDQTSPVIAEQTDEAEPSEPAVRPPTAPPTGPHDPCVLGAWQVPEDDYSVRIDDLGSDTVTAYGPMAVFYADGTGYYSYNTTGPQLVKFNDKDELWFRFSGSIPFLWSTTDGNLQIVEYDNAKGALVSYSPIDGVALDTIDLHIQTVSNNKSYFCEPDSMGTVGSLSHMKRINLPPQPLPAATKGP
ncbi:hypothetical protein [Catellatospora sichuanensis]|uniref:hypothetical protein n=1 Tax=Catellatospora sichuanensis TaxID=1969805 RepID=UPI0011844AFA|nr:hypothetical protein [Catellatospora sichuanensis]